MGVLAAREDQDQTPGSKVASGEGQSDPVQRSRHVDVGDEQVKVTAALQQFHCSIRALRLLDPVAQVFEGEGQVHPDQKLVFYEEDL